MSERVNYQQKWWHYLACPLVAEVKIVNSPRDHFAHLLNSLDNQEENAVSLNKKWECIFLTNAHGNSIGSMSGSVVVENLMNSFNLNGEVG